MLRKSAEIVPVVREHMRDGDGAVTTLSFLSQAESHDTGRLFGKLILPAGASIGMHEHVGEFEVYYILSGEGIVNDGERDYRVEPGDMYLCDDGERHLLRNDGSDDLVLLAIIPLLRG